MTTSRTDATAARVGRMTRAEFDLLIKRIDGLEAHLKGLPDKAAIYTASLAIHGVIWGTILGTVMVLNALGVI